MTTLVMAQAPLYNNVIDPNDNKYNCCCESCHVKSGTQIIGVLEAVFVTLNMIWAMANYAQVGEKYTGTLFGGVISSIVWLLIIGLMFYGLAKEKHGYLIPHLVIQVLGIIILFVAAILSLVLLASGGGLLATMLAKNSTILAENSTKETQQAVAGGLIVGAVLALIVYSLAAALEIWFFTIVLGCYRYLRDLHFAKIYQQQAVTTYGPPLVPMPQPNYPVVAQYPYQTHK